MFMPYGTANENFPKWQPKPISRGTFSILSTCVMTLLLCFCTAIYLNIPEHARPKKQIARKAALLILAMFAPEIVGCIYSTRLIMLIRDLGRLYGLVSALKSCKAG
jgi:hypothetical protein